MLLTNCNIRSYKEMQFEVMRSCVKEFSYFFFAV